jgi:serine/threonine protein kinase
MSSKKLKPGVRFGPWELVEEIGGGGNAVVWKVTNINNGGSGAIKLIKTHHLDKVDGQRGIRLKRFYHEIDFLKSPPGEPGVIKLLDDHCPDDPTDEDRPWYVMPLGIGLQQAVGDTQNKLEFAVKAIAEVAAAAARLHENGVFHRDIKPDNILMIEGSPVLSDFGLVDFPGKEAVTAPGEFMGPMFYIAPEMMTNAADDPSGKADVYSLAKTLWVIVTGQKYPLPGEQRVFVPALTLSAYVNVQRCRSLDLLLDHATRHDPSARPTMRVFADELKAWTDPPRAEAPMSNQLFDIAKQYRPIQESLEETYKREERCESILEEISSKIRTKMETLVRDMEGMELKGSTGVVVKPRLYDSPGYPSYWDMWTTARGLLAGRSNRERSLFIIQQLFGLRGRSVAYSGGVRLTRIGQSEKLNVLAAHAFGSINADAEFYNECTWKAEIDIQADMPSAERGIDVLLGEFAKQPPDAIRGMLNLIDRIGKVHPP